MQTQLLYVTCKDTEEANTIGRTLVQERLVACVNILPAIQSLYWWNDEVQNDCEVAFFAKTTQQKAQQVIERICQLHSYECPCVVTLPIEKGNPDFLNWVTEQTKK